MHIEIPGALRILIGLAALLPSSSMLAHHSFSAEFDVGKPVELTGKVTQMEWTNPHAWLHVEVSGEQGGTQQWAVELLGVNALIRSGMRPDTVKPGDLLTVTGFGARDGSNTANASSVKRSDTGEALWSSARPGD